MNRGSALWLHLSSCAGSLCGEAQSTWLERKTEETVFPFLFSVLLYHLLYHLCLELLEQAVWDTRRNSWSSSMS